MSTQSWEYNGVNLNTLGWNVRLLGTPAEVPGRRGENVVIPGRRGRLLVNKELDQRVVSLGMFVKDVHPTAGGTGSEAQLKTNLDALRGLFAGDGQHTLKWAMAAQTRVAQAEVISAVEFSLAGPSHYNFVIQFALCDPLWYAETDTTVGPTNLTASPTNLAITNPGTYWSFPVITIACNATGSITNPRITIGSAWVQYTGAVGNNETLVIDCEDFTAELDSVDMSGNISHSEVLAWLAVPAGISTAVVTGTIGALTPTAQIDFTPAYI